MLKIGTDHLLLLCLDFSGIHRTCKSTFPIVTHFSLQTWASCLIPRPAFPSTLMAGIRRLFNMEKLFRGSQNLQIDVSNWDTSSVMNMEYLFAYTRDFGGNTVSTWDTSPTVRMTSMFRNSIFMSSSGLEQLPLPRRPRQHLSLRVRQL